MIGGTLLTVTDVECLLKVSFLGHEKSILKK
jgi:hypothetical protein